MGGKSEGTKRGGRGREGAGRWGGMDWGFPTGDALAVEGLCVQGCFRPPHGLRKV